MDPMRSTEEAAGGVAVIREALEHAAHQRGDRLADLTDDTLGALYDAHLAEFIDWLAEHTGPGLTAGEGVTNEQLAGWWRARWETRRRRQ
jgi:hypothetical protein